MPSPHLALDLWTVLVDKRTVKRLTERVGVLQAPLYSVKQDQIDCEIKAVSINSYVFKFLSPNIHNIAYHLYQNLEENRSLQNSSVNMC